MNYNFVEKAKEKKFEDVIPGEVIYDSHASGECFMKLYKAYSFNGKELFNAVNIKGGYLTHFPESEIVTEVKISCTVEVALGGK